MPSHLIELPSAESEVPDSVTIRHAAPAARRPIARMVAFWDRQLRPAIGVMASLSLHALLLLWLASWVFTPCQPAMGPSLLWVLGDSDEWQVSDLMARTVPVVITPDTGGEPEAELAPVGAPTELSVPAIALVPQAVRPIPSVRASTPTADGAEHVRRQPQFVAGGGLAGRNMAVRARHVGGQGGSIDTERAVELGLAWLAAHQRDDGGWRFDFHEGPCGGRCRDNGTIGTSTGATALALLPFLGADNTPHHGPYQETVRRGMDYLLSRKFDTEQGADYQEGTMYAQGLAAIVLCEVLAMTGDSAYRKPAQDAIRFIEYAQHAEGGWRYRPRQPGDTTVFGWQLMALKSASLAELDVSPDVMYRAERYLDSVQTEYGTYYGYIAPAKELTPTAVGLLSRMYLGWARDDHRLTRGIKYLARAGPSNHDMYFNYYGSLALHHYGGKSWQLWNRRLKPYLIKTQEQQGHETGSWHFVSEHANQAGRIYTTAMCTMILEVYYRYLPLYRQDAIEADP